MDNFDPGSLTLCAQIRRRIRPHEEKVNVDDGNVPTNFKSLDRQREEHRRFSPLEKEIDSVRFDRGDGTKIELPVKLRVYDSIFVPLAKWSMHAGRQLTLRNKDGMRTSAGSVHATSRRRARSYNLVFEPGVSWVASPSDLVAVETYAAAAQRPVRRLRRPPLQTAPRTCERAESSYSLIASRGLSHPAIDAQVALVDERLAQTGRKQLRRYGPRPRRG